jgi:DNA-binding transcriptional ArsR family regulator
MSEENPNYYANIPSPVRYDPNLSPSAKLLYGEITALTSVKGYCWAKNQYFANLYGVSKSTVSRWIAQLEATGHVKTTIRRSKTHQIVDRRIQILLRQPTLVE